MLRARPIARLALWAAHMLCSVPGSSICYRMSSVARPFRVSVQEPDLLHCRADHVEYLLGGIGRGFPSQVFECGQNVPSFADHV